MAFDFGDEDFERIIINKDAYLGVEHIQRFSDLIKECFNTDFLGMEELQIYDMITPASPDRSRIQILFRPLTDDDMLRGHFVCSFFDTETIYIYDSLNEKKDHSHL